MSGTLDLLDEPGTACHLQSHGCTHLTLGHGGFDQHHPVPVELGGDAAQPVLTVCPIHHRRQHALIRYLVEQHKAGVDPAWPVLEHFTTAERDLAYAAVRGWVDGGEPAVHGWSCPAARALTDMETT